MPNLVYVAKITYSAKYGNILFMLFIFSKEIKIPFTNLHFMTCCSLNNMVGSNQNIQSNRMDHKAKVYQSINKNTELYKMKELPTTRVYTVLCVYFTER